MPSESTVKWFTYPGNHINLRRVGPGLFVGGEHAVYAGPGLTGKPWHTVIDLYGTSQAMRHWYAGAKHVIPLLMRDGQPFADGTLDAMYRAYRTAEGRPVLIHCQAGLSRSASAAYAMLRRRYRLSHDAALKRVQTPGYVGKFPLEGTLNSARTWARAAGPRAAANSPVARFRALR